MHSRAWRAFVTCRVTCGTPCTSLCVVVGRALLCVPRGSRTLPVAPLPPAVLYSKAEKTGGASVSPRSILAVWGLGAYTTTVAAGYYKCLGVGRKTKLQRPTIYLKYCTSDGVLEYTVHVHFGTLYVYAM